MVRNDSELLLAAFSLMFLWNKLHIFNWQLTASFQEQVFYLLKYDWFI